MLKVAVGLTAEEGQNCRLQQADVTEIDFGSDTVHIRQYPSHQKHVGIHSIAFRDNSASYFPGIVWLHTNMELHGFQASGPFHCLAKVEETVSCQVQSDFSADEQRYATHSFLHWYRLTAVCELVNSPLVFHSHISRISMLF